jgi:hypothetical protein
MASETFAPANDIHPDWSAAANWSAGAVPGAGSLAIISGLDAWIDPQTTLAAAITLVAGGGLIGNDGGFLLAPSATLLAADSNALYGDGAIVNDGTIAMIDGTLTVVVGAGSNIAQAYGLAEPSFENAGGIYVGGGMLAIDGTEFSNIGTVFVSNSGVLSVAGGWVDGGQGAVPPGGVIDIAGGLADFSDGVVEQDFVFGGPGTIVFDDPGDVRAVEVSGFGYGDEILAPSVLQAQSLLDQALTFTTALPAGETLAVAPVSGGADAGRAAILAVNDGGVPPCFARGTRLLTPAGYVPVEQLRPDDLVVTAAGVAERLVWVGWRTLDLADHRRLEAVRPIRVKAGAIADGVPARDVRLSPDHALLLGGRLVPVKFLVNNATIVRDTHSLAVTYFHVELERHGVVLAENLPAETYLDTGNRSLFENSAGTANPSPVFGRGRQWDGSAFAPLCTSGAALRAIRQAVFDRMAAQGYRHQLVPEITLAVGGKRIPRSFGPAWLPCFRLPAPHGGTVGIRSATFVPAEMAVGPGDDEDWRTLGIGIRRIRLDKQIYAPSEVAVAGFHPRASGDIADWTDGYATIAVPKEARILGLNILALPKAWLIVPGQ